MRKTHTVLSWKLTTKAAVLCSALALGGCKQDEADKAAEAKAADDAKADAEAQPAAAGEAAPAPAYNANRQASPATRLQRGEVIGHVLIPNASELLTEVNTQLSVPQVAMMINEGFLRGMVGAQLGDRGPIAQNVDLKQPLGCAVLDPTTYPNPVSCVVGYTGGPDKLIGDLGADGKQADAAGHIAHFKLAGQDLFIDKLGEHVVVSGHAQAFDKTKSYLQDNLLARANKVVSDVEAVGYLAEILERYKDQLRPILDQMAQAQTLPMTGDSKAERVGKIFTDYNKKSTTDAINRFKEMEQVTIGLGLEPSGFVIRFAIFATPGSRLENESKANSGGAMRPELVRRLPANTWLLGAATTDREKAFQTESFKELVALTTKAYEELTGNDSEAAAMRVGAFLAENVELYANEAAFVVSFEPGTLGGAMVVQPMKPGKSGRDSWKSWSEKFTPAAVLGKDGSEYVTWSFKVDAANVDGVAVDRWVIEPTDKSLAEMRKEGGAKLTEWENRLGGLKLTIDRAEVDGHAIFLVAPNAEDAYMKAAVGALKGTGSLEGNAGLDKALARGTATSSVFAFNGKKTIEWARAILPPDVTSKIPANLGNDLSDVVIGTSYQENGAQIGEIVISQPFIDQGRALVPQQ